MFLGHDIRVHCDYYRQTDKPFRWPMLGSSSLQLNMEQYFGPCGLWYVNIDNYNFNSNYVFQVIWHFLWYICILVAHQSLNGLGPKCIAEMFHAYDCFVTS